MLKGELLTPNIKGFMSVLNFVSLLSAILSLALERPISEIPPVLGQSGPNRTSDNFAH